MSSDPVEKFCSWQQWGIWPRLLEAYVQGTTEVHVHFRGAVAGVAIPEDWCAVFNRATDEQSIYDCTMTHCDFRQAFKREQCETERSVLIPVGQLIQLPEWMEECRIIPSIVRLQLLDDCLHLRGDSLETTFASGCEPMFIEADRKRRNFLDLLGQRTSVIVNQGKLVNDVVEGGAQVLQTIPDDQGEFSGWLPQGLNVDDVVAAIDALRVELSEDTIGAFFDPPSDFGFKALQVMECPV